eukprot:1321945-Pleurochrysis_carterae.AAC.2
MPGEQEDGSRADVTMQIMKCGALKCACQPKICVPAVLQAINSSSTVSALGSSTYPRLEVSAFKSAYVLNGVKRGAWHVWGRWGRVMRRLSLHVEGDKLT